MVLEHASIAALGELFAACEIRLRAESLSSPHGAGFQMAPWWFSFGFYFAVMSDLLPSPVCAANGDPENAADGDPCRGIRPCELGGEFTINEMLAQRPYPIRRVCESRCFWQTVVPTRVSTPTRLSIFTRP
jgi:hypothetical protein